MSKFDKTLDQILVSQVNMMDPTLRGKAERKKLKAEEKLRLLQNLTAGQTSDGARMSAEGWMESLIRIQKLNAKLPKKQRRKNAKFLQQLQDTAAASNKSWKVVSEGRAAKSAKF